MESKTAEEREKINARRRELYLKRKQETPERHDDYLRRQREKDDRLKKKREEYWASETRQALEDKTAYRQHKREVNRKAEIKKRMKESGVMMTRISTDPPILPRINRLAMTIEERKAHDKEVAAKRQANKSRQRVQAEKKKKSDYMKEYRMQMKLLAARKVSVRERKKLLLNSKVQVYQFLMTLIQYGGVCILFLF